jgi:hypothetical protein
MLSRGSRASSAERRLIEQGLLDDGDVLSPDQSTPDRRR